MVVVLVLVFVLVVDFVLVVVFVGVGEAAEVLTLGKASCTNKYAGDVAVVGDEASASEVTKTGNLTTVFRDGKTIGTLASEG